MFYQNPSLALHGNSYNIVKFNFNDTHREKLCFIQFTQFSTRMADWLLDLFIICLHSMLLLC